MENSRIVLAQKWALLAFLAAGITLLHYSTEQSSYYFRVFYGELYCLPIVLAAFWFGVRKRVFVGGRKRVLCVMCLNC